MSSKPEKPTYDWLELGTIPFPGHAFNYKDEFLLSDNLPEYIEDWENRPHFKEAKFHDMPPIRLNYIHILLCLQGELSIQVNFKDILISKNHLFLGSPGDLCVFERTTEDVRFVNFAIKNKFYVENAPKDLTVDLRKMIMENPCFPLEEQDAEAFLNIYKMLGVKLVDPDFAFKDELIKSYLTTMGLYGRQWVLKSQATPKSAETRQEDIYKRFMELVSSHFREQHEIAFYADKLCITPKYLSQIIHQVSGKFANEWIRDYLILESKALLKSRKYTVLQVSEVLNFPNPSFYSQYFKRIVGCTPKQYMQQ